MSTVIARDTQASTQLVYTWPFPIGAECHVQCNVDDVVIMCPSWVVGNRLGPGQHHWRTPDPMRPSTAYFVSTSPMEVDFDLVTTFPMPLTMQLVRVRANGAVTVRCSDPAMLVAQFVGLPFYDIDRGLRSSVARSVERMLARLLVRRTVITGSPMSIIDQASRAAIADELIAYHPTGGAVFGLDFGRLLSLEIAVDDGSQPLSMLGRTQPAALSKSSISTVKTEPMARAAPTATAIIETPTQLAPRPGKAKISVPPPLPAKATSPERSVKDTVRGHASALGFRERTDGGPPAQAVPEILAESSSQTIKVPVAPVTSATRSGANSQTLANATHSVQDVVTSSTPLTGGKVDGQDDRGSILSIGGIGVGTSNVIAGELSTKIPAGGQVLVQGNNGLMQAAIVKQLLAGYYELEVGATGEVVWVPMAAVVPQPSGS